MNFDKLEQMLNLQKELMEKYYTPTNIESMTLAQKEKYTIDTTIALEDEISEVRKELNWKWWKKPKKISMPNLKYELIDVFFFVLTLLIVWEMTPEEIFEHYTIKWRENCRRQMEGY